MLFEWKIRRGGVVLAAFTILGIVTVTNLNGFMQMKFGLGNILSPLILTVSVLVCWNVPKSIYKSVISCLRPYYIFMGLYLSIGTLSAVIAGGEIDHLLGDIKRDASSVVVVTASSLGMAYYMQSKGYTRAIKVIYILSVLVLVSVAYGAIDPSIYHYHSYGQVLRSRYSGFFANPNEAGIALVVVSAISLYYLSKRINTLVNSVVLTLCGIAVLYTFSRASLIIWIVMVALFLVSLGFGKGRIFVVAFVIALCALFIYGAKDGSWDRIQQQRIDSLLRIASSGNVTESETHRVTLMTLGLEMFTEKPVLGNGLGSVQRMKAANGLGSHNTYLVVLGESGIFTFIFFLLMLAQYLEYSLRIKDTALRRYVMSYFFVFLSMLFFTHNGLTHRNHNFYLGISIGILAVFGRRADGYRAKNQGDMGREIAGIVNRKASNQ